jgi:flagellar hook-associated protein 2
MAMPGFSLSGLASGLDTNTLITQLMAIERQPRVRLDQDQAVVQARQSALRDIATRLRNLKTVAADLRLPGIWSDTQTVESSDTTKVTAERLGGTGPGGYNVEVISLARAEQRTYAFTPSAAATTITIGGKDVEIPANATLDDAVASINSTSDVPVYATNVNGSLVLSSRLTGAANGFTATGASIAEDTAKAKLGADASYKIDGVDGTSSSNVIGGVGSDATVTVPGLKLTLKGPTSSPVTVTVGAPGPDQDAIKAKVKGFVEQYNSTVDFIRSKLTEERVANPQTTADRLKGVLRGDTELNGLLTQLRSTFSTLVGADGKTLRDIGISTGATTGDGTVSKDAIQGKLVLDEAKLADALKAGVGSVRALIGADGLAQAIDGLVDPVTRSDGVLDQRIASADTDLKDIRDRMSVLDQRLATREAALRRQFTTLETVLSQAQSRNAAVQSQLVSLMSAK